MRISDWSSDVCSSDLFPSFPSFPQLPSKKIAAETLPPSTWQPAEPTHLLRYPVHLRAAHCGPCPFPLQRQHEDPPCSTQISCPCCWRPRRSRRPRRTPPPPKIGRASCRERGCQYG